MRTPSGITIPEKGLTDVCRRYHVRQLALFGSVLRDDFGPDSDIDGLVEFEPDAVVGLIRFGGLKEELESLFGREVDLIPTQSLNPHVRSTVLASAETVYASAA